MEIADLLLQICPDYLFVACLVSDKIEGMYNHHSLSVLFFVMNILDDESYLVPPMQKPTLLTIHAFLNYL
jgi:hypothetical protein